ncbi:MAG: AAA family ATPase, partial [Gammaproteobacteria bacterium]|nr:AAA family ATPase [Gammaproteobacteria bacterium]
MIPKGKSGRGFKGAANYLLHDKGGATTSKRVEWTQVENMRSDQSKRAWQEMLWTSNHAEELKRATGQKMTGRKAEKPVYHLSLSWAKDETPTQDEMIAAGKGALKSIGLEKHQALYVCHNDEPQPHIHILVNRVDHETGLMNTLSRSNRKLSAWAMKYELRQGKVLCEKRLENSHKLEQGNQPRHKDQNIKEAWERSDSGKAFEQALAEKGYVLAQGTKRIVVVDPYGKVMNPTRHLYGVKAADIRARLTDLDTAHLPKADAVRKLQIAAREAEDARTVGKEDKAGGQQTFELDRHNAEGTTGILDIGSAKERSSDAREEFNLKSDAQKPDKILKHLTSHQAVFSVAELRAALKGNEQDAALVKTLEQDGKILRLHERETGEATDTFTTPEVRAHEQSVLDCAERLTNRPGWQIDEGSLEATSARRTLDAEQRAAMTHALSPKGLTVIEGRAGTGKSHTLGAVREALTANDYRVIGLAPTNTVAIDLQKDGFSEARTVHSLLWHIDHQRPEGNLDKNTVLVVDEAAMLDTNIMDRLLQEAERGKSKVILVGDDRQLASVSRGGMFGAITDRLGSAEITKVRRQREAWDRQAAQDFATGRFADGVEAYEQHGRIHWTADLEEARTALVKQWAKDTQDGIGNRFVFGYTNEEVDRLNQSLRQVEIERGRVDSSRSIEIETERFGTVQLAKGDRVQFRSNDKPQGIVNGLLGTVQQISADGAVQVRSDNGRSITFSAGDERCPEVQHGYAGTLYRGQGKTLDEAYLLHTYHWRDRPSYVAMTRARGAAKLFVARDQARGVTALVRQMGRSSDRGSSLQFSTAEDLQNREASGRKSEQHERIEKLAGSVRTEMQSRQIDET